jgi:hypothetical protein
MLTVGAWVQPGGSSAPSRATVSADSTAALPPLHSSASAAITPGPAPLLTIASRSPCSGRACASVDTAANSSSVVNTRSMPARRIAASYTSSTPARPPLWHAAARGACSERPDLITTVGLLRAAARAADMNLRA